MALCISVLQKHCNKNTYYVFDHHWFCSGSLRKHSACICDKILSFYCRNIFLCKYHFRFPILTPIRNKFDGLDIKRLIFFFFFFTKENYVSSHFQREIFKILSLWWLFWVEISLSKYYAIMLSAKQLVILQVNRTMTENLHAWKDLHLWGNGNCASFFPSKQTSMIFL